jgi:hypothetical protein
MFNLFPHLPFWATLIIVALAVYAVFNRRKIFLLIGNVLMPNQVKSRWNALAEKKDMTSETEMMGNAIVEKLTEEFVEQLPVLLSVDFTEQVRADVMEQLPMLLSDGLVDRILAKLPEAMEQRAANTIANLTAQVNSLRKQVKGGGDWVPVGVHVRGFKMSEDDKAEYFALVEFNYQVGGLRAVQNPKDRLLVCKSYLNHSCSPFKGRIDLATWMGAPWYGKVNGDPKSIVMCGEAYKLLQ